MINGYKFLLIFIKLLFIFKIIQIISNFLNYMETINNCMNTFKIKTFRLLLEHLNEGKVDRCTYKFKV